MITYSFRRLGPRLVTAAAMKWMKWKAAARWSGLRPLLYPTCVDAVLSGH